MVFNSYIFIFLFLPITLVIYYGLNYFEKYTLGKIFLIGMSFWFYAYYQLTYLFLLIIGIVFNFVCSRALCRRKKSGKMFLTISIGVNIGSLFYFKYFDFLIENINAVFDGSFQEMDILMPLGISFLTFQQIAFLVDSWRGETENVGFVDYALFVSFFPKLAEGPIVLHDELIPQFQDGKRKQLDEEKFACGLWTFSTGLFKKVLLADTLAVCVDWGYANPASLTGLETFLVITMYAFQLYFDFSGYCDMAMGIANMLNLDLPANFHSPYKARSIIDFWGRWHLTLTRFLRKYLYFPLGGSKGGEKRRFRNILIVFIVSGFWHGASWTFILWGLFHGILNVITRIVDPVWKRVPAVFQGIATFLTVDLLWVLFRAGDFSTAKIMYRNLFSGWRVPLQQSFLECFDVIELTYVEEHVTFLQRMLWTFPAMNFAVIFTVCVFWVFIPQNINEEDFRPTKMKAIGSIVMLVWSVMSLSQLSSFLYFYF